VLPWLAAAMAFYYLGLRHRGWGRHVLLGLGFFFLMLLPFSGIAPISFMNFTWVMDHFLYLPMLGLLGLVVAGWEKLHARLPAGLRRVDAGVIGVLLFCLAVQSQDAAAMWTDRETLWRSTLALNSRAWLAHYNLGNVLREEDRIPEAIAEYRAALDLRPNFAWGHDNLGLALAAEGGKDDEAVAEYRTALRLEPGLAEAHNNLANALAPSPGGLPEAIAEYRAALRLRPGLVAAHYNLGVALSKTPGQSAAARAEFQEALRLDPSLEAARERLAEPGR
jgi:tetratricopeptide (TPR) repeat protein